MNMNIKFEYAANKQKHNSDRFYSGQGIKLTLSNHVNVSFILCFFCENSVAKRLVHGTDFVSSISH